jgi:cell division protein FtsB
MSSRSDPLLPGRARSIARGSRRRWAQYILLFSTAALIVNALIGDRGLTALLKARREYADLRAAVDAARRENSALREEVRRLRLDPATIEEAARRELGLARKDELVFIIKDVAPRR